MGLENSKCDSCNEKKDILFPIAILIEAPYGNTMAIRYYCLDCKEVIETEANLEDEDLEEEKDKDE